MRAITTHHDGYGLNDIITIEPDEEDPNSGGASHNYVAKIHGGSEPRVVTIVNFQHGPRNEPNSNPGVTEAVLLAILIDRMSSFQAGPYACRENALVKTKCEEALHWLNHRTAERVKRGVLGKNQK